MSIKNSLRLSLMLLAACPLIFMTILTYALSYNRYLSIAENSASSYAEIYGEGFNAQLNVQIATIEGLSQTSNIQNLLLEAYNGLSLGPDSSYYEPVVNLLSDTSFYMDEYISFYLYDINGYYICGSNNISSGDWQEFMDVPVSDINKTSIMKSSNINKDSSSIELITPVLVKGKVIGLLRANISSKYFGAFIPESGDAFILTSSGDYLFNSVGFSEDSNLENEALALFNKDNLTNGFLSNSSGTARNIYGYFELSDYDYIYFIRQDGKNFQQLLTTLPITLLITLVSMIIAALVISHFLTKKYTDPIITLRNDMTEAASGNLDIVSKIDSKNEFGELSENFNTMMNIISNNYKELSESKEELEKNENELKANYDKIEQLAYHDGLTGLYNRIAFFKHAHEIFNSDGVSLDHHAIFFIDLDNFKNVNDTLGHDYGDILLKQVADHLSSYIDKSDVLARTGGDEFLILKTTYNSIQELGDFAQNLIDIAKKPFQLEDEVARISMSIGIAIFPSNGLTISELIKNADIAMYSAKTSGKNSYRFFSSYMEDNFNRKNDIADILENVINNNEIYLQYQPQANVNNGEITGCEALMRIDSEIFGFLSPAEFIPIAEDSGIINQLGEWALYEACRFNQSLIEKGYGNLKMSVNVSTLQMKDDHLLDIIASIPEKTGMALENLEIEITESVLMTSLEHNLELINKIKDLGVRIALDDFGTGYSSFNYLTQIPINTLKIDKSFIDRICINEKDKSISSAIINLSHTLGISVVAEGVEVVDQLKILQEQKCNTIQGYLFSRPLLADKYEALLEKSKERS